MSTLRTLRIEVHDNGTGATRRQDVDGPGPHWIGRDAVCDLVLPSQLVSRRHATLSVDRQGIVVQDRSANGTWVDDEAVVGDQRQVGGRVALRIGPFRLAVTTLDASLSEPAPHQQTVCPATRREIHRTLLDHLDLVNLERKQFDRESMAPRVEAALGRIYDQWVPVLPAGERDSFIATLTDEVLGLGPLEGLLSDADVSEIMVIDARTIYAERSGRIVKTDLAFTDDESVRAIIERIVTPLGRRIDESAPLVDARLPDGSRVNAVIPPLANRGPCITIRKFASVPLTLDDLVAKGSLTERMGVFLTRAVRCRRNIVISGGTGSGKTTLLNVMSGAIPEAERVVTIEDAAELNLAQEHVVSLEARPPNMEGKGEYSIRDLVRNALRMRPDRIVVGECRGGEAIDMLQAMNTGHEGSMTTTHANSPREAVARLETLCLMAGVDLPIAAVRHQIASSVHLIVQQSRFSDGSRRVTRITEVGGLDDCGQLVLHDIFHFVRSGTNSEGDPVGDFRSTGYLPSFLDEFVANGLIDDGVYL